MAKILTFPPMVAVILAGVASMGGGAALAAGVSPLPASVTALLAPLAAANRPLVLITLGVLFQPVLPRIQVGPDRYRSPRQRIPLNWRHGLPFNSRNEGPK